MASWSTELAELFPISIPRVEWLQDLRPVVSLHTGEAQYSQDSTGRVWVRKRESNIQWEALLAESLSWLLGRRLGAPIPDAAVHLGSESERSWLSAQLVPVQHWDPSCLGDCSNLEDLGAVLVLDLITLNNDRHSRNILLEVQASRSLKLWAIDSDSALVGWPIDYANSALRMPTTDSIARGLPVDLVRSMAIQKAEEAAGIPGVEIRGFVAEACDIAREPQIGGLADAVIDRCSAAVDNITRYIDAIEAKYGAKK